ncbi:MAG: hypothetical protein JJV94_03480 [Sulfurospirillum sp.]|nr:hypothetical protein [Sulfurospirillum sp.]
MLNKLFALAVRAGITFGIGFAPLFQGFELDDDIRIILVFGIWILGGIYSFLKFNQPFNINALEKADKKIHSAIDDQSKKKIEGAMLRIKKLLDSGILTQEEYSQKMEVLKNKYL